MAGIEGVVAV